MFARVQIVNFMVYLYTICTVQIVHFYTILTPDFNSALLNLLNN